MKGLLTTTCLASVLMSGSCNHARAAGVERIEAPDQQKPYLAVLQTAPAFVNASAREDRHGIAPAATAPATAVAADNRIILAQMLRMTPDAGGPPPADPPTVQTLHFVYATGKTIRSTINDQTKGVMKVEVLEAYPTPLAPEEIDEATRLARDQVPAAQALGAEADVEVQALAAVVPDRQNPAFGHRIVFVSFQSKSDPSKALMAKVDLTLRTAKQN